MNVSTMPLDKLTELTVEVTYVPTVRFEGQWFDRKEVYEEVDRRVRDGRVANWRPVP